ncbi:MAG: hypothetical protein Hyperionvirus1_149 [Hyperionvirus sp.]|uniref:Uncharacterized protein n=1 Tax=Hyperionvirus sp. TaxID=2487770 RepID=A0A3G5A5N8_9VIRU|nr:MAG: hypothetical protein Hyperionvirus1_149 [Hyperionvirus sp.]
MTTIQDKQDYKPLGSVLYTIDPNTRKSIPLKVNVHQPGQVLLTIHVLFNISDASSLPGSFSFDITRDGNAVTDGPRPILFGPPTYISGFYSLGWTIADPNVSSGEHQYILQLENTNAGTQFIYGLSFTATAFDNDGKLFNNQLFPPPREFAITLQPGSSVPIPIESNIEVKKHNSVMLWLLTGYQFQNTTGNVYFDFLRDGKTLNAGPQLFVNATGDGTGYSVGWNLLDSHVKPGTHNYSVNLINRGTGPITISYYSFNAAVTLNPQCGLDFSSKEKYLPTTIPPQQVKTIPNNRRLSIPIRASIHNTDSKVAININVRLNIPPTSSFTQFDILNPANESIINGPQNLSVYLGTGSGKFNKNLTIIDNKPIPGNSKYHIIFINNLNTSIGIEYYSITTVASKN